MYGYIGKFQINSSTYMFKQFALILNSLKGLKNLKKNAFRLYNKIVVYKKKRTNRKTTS